MVEKEDGDGNSISTQSQPRTTSNLWNAIERAAQRPGIAFFFSLFLISLLAYAPMLFSPYVYDDVVVIRDNELLRSFAGLLEIFRGHVDQDHLMDGTYRPLFFTFLSGFGKWVSFHPGPFRVWTALLHAANGFLIFKFATTLFRLPSLWAFSAVLFFLLHPLQSTNFGMVWKQSDVWIAFFALFSSWLLFKHSTRPQKSLLIFAFLLFFAALGTKESAIVIPLLWLTFEALFEKQKRLQRFGLAFFSLLFSYLYFKKLLPSLPQSSFENVPISAGRIQYFWTQLDILLLYVKAIFNPLLITIDRSHPLAPAPTQQIELLTYLFVIIFLVGFIFSYITKRRFLTLFLLGVVWLIPTSSFQPLALLYDETRLYLTLGALGLWIATALSELFTKFPVREPVHRLIVLAPSVCLLLTLWAQSPRWSSETKLWQSALEVSDTAFAHYFLGMAAQEEKALDEAEIQYRTALQIAPAFPGLRLNLGIVLGQKGNLLAARNEFIHLLDDAPYWAAQGHYYIGLNDLYAGHLETAERHFAAAQLKDPSLARGQKGMALLYAKKGMKAEAVSAWKKYIQTPGLPQKHKQVPRELKSLVGDVGSR